MSRFSRRKFLGTSAALPLGLGLGGAAQAQTGRLTGSATMIVTGANILTMNPSEPRAEAIAIRGDRILAVGSNEEILFYANASTQRIDGRGLTVM